MQIKLTCMYRTVFFPLYIERHIRLDISNINEIIIVAFSGFIFLSKCLTDICMDIV